jgi:hypothetical protein
VKRLAAIAFFCMTLVSLAFPQSEQDVPSSSSDEEHTEWIASALRSIQTIKVGVTRSELMKVFTTEGGRVQLAHEEPTSIESALTSRLM